MAQFDPVLCRQLPVIQKIIADETWYEGERRGCYVAPDDPVVQEHVCLIILRIGRELRETITADFAAHAEPRMHPAHEHCQDAAA